MSHDVLQHLYGKPENVLKYSSNKTVEIEQEPIERLLQHEEVKDRNIVVFSLIGPYRKGKSFFLDYCLRFLYANYSSINCPNNFGLSSYEWMGDEHEPLTGFSWRSGSVRDTTGIVIWNDIFLYTDDCAGDKIAIILMDTQGLFDNNTTSIDNCRIFAFGTLASSIQVLNLSGVIQENQLQYLQFATEFAKLTASNCHKIAEKPFQNLTFLVRDWQNPHDHPFGIEGGDEYLNNILKIRTHQKEELNSVRRSIQTSFEELSCSLLPYPGRTVAEGMRKGKKYNGSWGGMNEDFKDELEKIIEHLLGPDKLVAKKIDGNYINGCEFLEYIKLYFKFMQSDELPKVQSIYESIIEKEMNILIQLCVEKYMETVSENKSVISSITQIPTVHNFGKNQALFVYKEVKKLGSSEHEIKFRKILENQIQASHRNWKKEMEANITKIEKEKKKIEEKLEKKQKKEREKIESEKKLMEDNYRKELSKLQSKLEQERRSKNNEIAMIKRQKESDRKALEEQFRMEKEEARKSLEQERLKNEKELRDLKQQIERKKKALEEQAKLEKLERDLELKSIMNLDLSEMVHEIDFLYENFQLEMSNLL